MDGITRAFLIFGIGLFSATLLALIVFPVEAYERAKESRRLNEFAKGLFAQSVISMYQIKKDGLAAAPTYWWHLVWFNTLSAAVLSFLVTFGLYIIFIVVVTIIVVAAIIIGVGTLAK